MKMIQIITFVILMSSCSGIFGTEKFEMNKNLEKDAVYISEVIAITEQYSDGELLLNDTMISKAYVQVLEKTNDYYILESKEEMDKSYVFATMMKLNDIVYKTKIDKQGHLIDVINDNEVYEALYKSITSPIKMFANMIEDSEEKKKQLAKMDSIFRIGFSKDRLLSIVEVGYKRSDYTEFIGKSIGERFTYDTEFLVQMIGMVKSKREFIINKTPEGKFHIVVTDTLDSEDYSKKANALSELDGKGRKVVADDADVLIVVNNSMIVNPENGIIESQTFDMIVDMKTEDYTSKKVEKFVITSLGKKN